MILQVVNILDGVQPSLGMKQLHAFDAQSVDIHRVAAAEVSDRLDNPRRTVVIDAEVMGFVRITDKRHPADRTNLWKNIRHL